MWLARLAAVWLALLLAPGLAAAQPPPPAADAGVAPPAHSGGSAQAGGGEASGAGARQAGGGDAAGGGAAGGGAGGDAGGGGSAAAAPPTPEPEPSATPPLDVDDVVEFSAEDKIEQGGHVLRSIIGLLVLLVLAWLGAHPRVRRIERELGLSSAITAGLPFVAFGLLARHPAVGILTDEALATLSPLLQFGLGWLGLLVGTQVRINELDRLPRGVSLLVATQTSVPFLLIAVACGALMLALGVQFSDATFVRDGVVLATAGAMTSPIAVRLLANSRSGRHPLVMSSELDEIAGVLGLAFLAAYFRPRFLESTWEIPGTAWLFVTLGMGMTIGMVIYVVLRRPATPPEFLAIALGSVAFTAGLAAYVHLSPIVVCFVVGVVVANVSGDHCAQLVATLRQLERPIYLVFLVLVGALWDVTDWRGWLLMVVFVVSRFVGLGLSGVIVRRKLGDVLDDVRLSQLSFVPLSVMSIAIVVSAQSLYQGRALPWIVTAVIGGAMATEIIAQLWRRFSGGGPEPSSSGLLGPPAGHGELGDEGEAR